jgi:ORF092
MGVKDIRTNVNKKKSEQEDARKMIADGFMSSIQKLMIDFNNKVESNQIEVKDPNDLYKLFVIFSQMQELSGATTEGGGAIPEISGKQQELFENVIDQNSDSEESNQLDLQKLSELSADDIANMISEKEQVMNQENSETF